MLGQLLKVTAGTQLLQQQDPSNGNIEQRQDTLNTGLNAAEQLATHKQ